MVTRCPVPGPSRAPLHPLHGLLLAVRARVRALALARPTDGPPVQRASSARQRCLRTTTRLSRRAARGVWVLSAVGWPLDCRRCRTGPQRARGPVNRHPGVRPVRLDFRRRLRAQSLTRLAPITTCTICTIPGCRQLAVARCGQTPLLQTAIAGTRRAPVGSFPAQRT